MKLFKNYSMSLKYIEMMLLKMLGKYKRSLVVILDIMCSFLAVWISYYLRLGEFVSFRGQNNEYFPLYAFIISILLIILIFNYFNIYKVILRFSGSRSIINFVKAWTLYGIMYASILTFISIDGVPPTIGIIQPLIFGLSTGFVRFVCYYYLNNIYERNVNKNKKKQILIYGAGKRGYQIAKFLSNNSEINIVGFLDDNILLKDNKVNELKIFSPKEIDELIIKKNINEIIIALDKINNNSYRKILDQFRNKNLTLRTLPSFDDIIKNKININSLHELSIEDILGHNTIAPKASLMRKDIASKVVLVSGAGGSIGSELCRQILYQKPKTLILLDNSEFALYCILEKLKGICSNNIELVSSLCSVTNENGIIDLLNKFQPHTIFHAAAYKHVNLLESNKTQCVNNNIFGTLVLAEKAIISGVKKFVFISSDKVVRPSNIMGASKRISEIIIQGLSAKQKNTIFSIVRFGNVLNSSGSIVPIFKSQIKAGGPVTITNKNITRYFITIKEAAELVIQAGGMSDNNSNFTQTSPIYILDMGKPVKIFDMAKLMIELSGLQVYDYKKNTGDIKIKITGLRPGEKMQEQIMIEKNLINTVHPKIKCINEDFIDWKLMKEKLSQLRKIVLTNNEKAISELVFKCVN